MCETAHIFKGVMGLDSGKSYISSQYHKNELMKFDKILISTRSRFR